METREAASRQRNPYVSPRAPARGSARRGGGGNRRALWWGVLLAPYLGLVLAIGVTYLLYKLGRPVPNGFRDTLISTSGLWAEISARAAFILPSAWILERVVRRLRPDSERFRLLTLPILVVAIYALGIVELLEHFGYVSQEGPLNGVMNFAVGVGTVAAIPLLVVWATLAFRQRGRRGR